jgi:hypothetical protein
MAVKDSARNTYMYGGRYAGRPIDRTSIEYLKDTFKIGYEAYEDSKEEALDVWDFYHNRQWTADQESIMENRGQPKETFNVIKLFARTLIGYYSTTINKIQALPVGMEDAVTSALINDVIDHVLRDNNFEAEGEKIKLCGLIAGLMCVYIDIQPTGEFDEFGREINRVILEYVPEHELMIDPMSKRDDYQDARWIHRFKWLSEEDVINLFGKKTMDKMIEYFNYTEADGADFEKHHMDTYTGRYRLYNNYLVVHSIVVDDKGKSWSIMWHDEMIIQKDEITHKDMKFPYRVVKTHTSDETEYYGIFREVYESQKAINQALVKFQLLVNSQKAFVQRGAVENLADFTHAFNRVTGVVPVRELKGIQIENLSNDALQQYAVIDKALDRIQRILGINDSFLGMAFASDSGRKVKLQQNASIIALRYFTGRLELFYKFLGWDIMNLIKQYYTATQVIRLADDYSGYRWVMLNQPEQFWTGQYDPQTGEPIMRYAYEEVLDPATQEPMEDEDGNMIMAPIPREETEIAFTNADIEVITTAYNDEDEKNQLLMETVLAGPQGQFLMQANPAAYSQVVGLSMQSMKTKHSPEIAKIYMQTAQMLGANMEAQQQAMAQAQQQGTGTQELGPNQVSQELKLPQNTNEGF